MTFAALLLLAMLVRCECTPSPPAPPPEPVVKPSHALELVGTGGNPSGKQRDCVLGVLSSPGYRLKPEQKQDLPSRISIVIEL